VSAIAWTDEGTGPVVVLLHAFPCNRSMWDGQVQGLVDAGWRVMAPDLPGFGDSALLAEPPSLTAVVEALVASLLERSVDRCVLVGLSVGGYLIMEWLRRHPEMVAGVVLCDTKASADTDEAAAGRLEMAAAVEHDPMSCSSTLRERLLPVIVGETTRSSRPEVVEVVANWMDAAEPASVAWYQRAMAVRPDSIATLSEAEMPALVLWGEEDAMAPREEQDAMVDALRDAGMFVIPRAGHLSAVENPPAVTLELAAFLMAVRRVNLEG
jgi:pimeloyl-ACP methyl ester carboxylesterase